MVDVIDSYYLVPWLIWLIFIPQNYDWNDIVLLILLYCG